MTRAMAYGGLPVDMDGLRDGINKLEKHLFEAKKSLPWYGEIDPDARKSMWFILKKPR